MFGVVLWGFVLGDCYISANRFRFFGYALEEVLILLFVVSGAPLMEVAIDAVFNLDIHGFKLIILLQLPRISSTPGKNKELFRAFK